MAASRRNLCVVVSLVLLLCVATVLVHLFAFPTLPSRSTQRKALCLPAEASATALLVAVPLPCLEAEHVRTIAAIHLTGVFRYQRNLKEALDDANNAGEKAREAERMRIWGFA